MLMTLASLTSFIIKPDASGNSLTNQPLLNYIAIHFNKLSIDSVPMYHAYLLLCYKGDFIFSIHHVTKRVYMCIPFY